MGEWKLIGENKCFGGYVRRYEHPSSSTKCNMVFSVFVPSHEEGETIPVLYFLSGLTCNDQNFITKAGAQMFAAREKIIIVAPDTSPRGCNIEGEEDSWDFGTGAGFYVNATEAKWKENYNMYSYVTEELPQVIADIIPNASRDRQSVFGHSMGGHGALICFLKNPGKYKSVSAFAPICNPINCPWGQKAFSGYLGADKETWQAYDATCLIREYSGPQVEILIDQGSSDSFLAQNQLLPEAFENACKERGYPVSMRFREGYDHSYYYIATFIEEHIAFHAKHLRS